jgi:hypothetical protein
MKTLIAINGEPSEKSLSSALAQNCDIVVVNNKKTNLPTGVNLLVVSDSTMFLKSSIQFAEKYTFLYTMENNTILTNDCIKIVTNIEDYYDGSYSDSFSTCQSHSNNRRYYINYYQSIIDKKIDTGQNKLLRISKNLPTSIDEILFSGKFLIKHIPIPAYFIEK